MTIQVNIDEKELNKKLEICRKLATLRSLQVDKFDFIYYLEKFTYLQEIINTNGNLDEVYNDLVHIENVLIEKIKI